LDAAERLFAERGFSAVKLKDIAAAVGIAHASLYHHVPGGKEQLYVEVMEHNLRRHQDGIELAIAQHPDDLRGQLHAIAGWVVSQPPMDFIRLTRSDMPAIAPQVAARLSQLALEAMIEPIARTLYNAHARGVVKDADLGLVAGGMFGMLQSMHLVPEDSLSAPRHVMANRLIDVFLDGLLKG
jgi:AcrR family transcriptional regulator